MIDQKKFYVYITSSQRNGTLYIGVTNDLSKRMQQHKSSAVSGFVTKYKATCLVYFEIFESVIAAIKREKQLKHWNRTWKLRLIEGLNPEWKDLSEQSLAGIENTTSLDLPSRMSSTKLVINNIIFHHGIKTNNYFSHYSNKSNFFRFSCSD